MNLGNQKFPCITLKILDEFNGQGVEWYYWPAWQDIIISNICNTSVVVRNLNKNLFFPTFTISMVIMQYLDTKFEYDYIILFTIRVLILYIKDPSHCAKNIGYFCNLSISMGWRPPLEPKGPFSPLPIITLLAKLNWLPSNTTLRPYQLISQ